MRRLTRPLAAFALGLALGASPAPAWAQAPDETAAAGEEGESKGDPLYAYVGTAFIAAGVIFVVCKSARR